MTKESERILTLELNLKNFMERVEEKFDAIINKLDEMPNIYATKEELKLVKKELCWDKKTKTVRIQTRWAIIVAVVSTLWYILSSIIK